MGEFNLYPPEHPRFPANIEALQDPQRSPTEHELRILDVLQRFREMPDFSRMAEPAAHRVAEAEHRVAAIAGQALDPVRDQDDRVLDLLTVIADFPEVFGNTGFILAAEIMYAARTNVETSEFRRSFYREYEPMIPHIRDYLRQAANLRRRGLAVKYSKDNVPQAQWGSPERRAAARERMELVEGLEDFYVLEKFWRTLEIVCSYPDFFSLDQYEMLVTRPGIELAWKAHLAKARQDFVCYRSIVRTGSLFRQMVDSGLDVLRAVIRERKVEVSRTGGNSSAA